VLAGLLLTTGVAGGQHRITVSATLTGSLMLASGSLSTASVPIQSVSGIPTTGAVGSVTAHSNSNPLTAPLSGPASERMAPLPTDPAPRSVLSVPGAGRVDMRIDDATVVTAAAPASGLLAPETRGLDRLVAGANAEFELTIDSALLARMAEGQTRLTLVVYYGLSGNY
jgi:hypothetical protein